MKRTLMLGGLAAAVACGSSAGDMMGEAFDDMTDVPDADAQSPGDGSTMQYVGNTSQAYPADIGLYAVYAACQSDYGEGHRICEADEIRYTTKLPNLAEGALAWYGTTACRGWTTTSSGENGSVVNDKGNTTANGLSVDTRCPGYAAGGNNGADPTDALPFACCGPK